MTKKFISQDGKFSTEGGDFFVTPFNDIKIFGKMGSPTMGSYPSQERATAALKATLSSSNPIVQFPK